MTKRPAVPDAGAEWLEADGLGGFASGTERRVEGEVSPGSTLGRGAT